MQIVIDIDEMSPLDELNMLAPEEEEVEEKAEVLKSKADFYRKKHHCKKKSKENY
jgi:hypothetical protein